MSEIIRKEGSIELTINGKHCVILGKIEDVNDEYILKLADWANSLWDYEKIKMWKKSDQLSPGYYITILDSKECKIHVLDKNMLEDLFNGSRKDSPPRLKNWSDKELIAYVDWCIEK